jgi:uracil-DNA glycosylase family 4
MIHSEQHRRAYLEALGIDVWVPRGESGGAVESGASAPEAAVTTPAEMDWEVLREAVANCTRCALCETRTQTVFGVGDPDADWMIIGEAPGAEEDRRGEPFVGRAGKLLDEMLRAVGQSRDGAFIANILKCRPPNNRDPKPEESAACRGYLERQIELVDPKIVLAVGRIAAQLLLETDAPVGRLRGSVHRLGDIPLVVTYHPAYLLRSPGQKRKAWDDLNLARRVLRERAA